MSPQRGVLYAERFRTRMAAIRAHLGLSRADLGARVGLDRYAIGSIEDGSRNLRLGEAGLICDVFHVSLDDMVGDQYPVLVDAKVIEFDPMAVIPHVTTTR